MKTAAIIVAAGRGLRAGDGTPKQYRKIGGIPVLRRAAEAFLHHPEVDSVLIVIHPDDRALYDSATEGLNLAAPVDGGDSRQASVLNGLNALEGADAPEIVLIHDAARAFVDEALISRVIAAVVDGKGAIPALPVADTLKRGNASNDTVESTVDRERLWRAQTPQGFPYLAILEAHRAASTVEEQDLTDDAAVAEAHGMTVAIVEGSERNIKLTRREDFDINVINEQIALIYDIRTGFGFDVHAFEAGDQVVLCGIKIPHDHALAGHSDADVALHALTDAILGGIAAGDIGDHFPPSDPEWAGASSDRFLRHALGLVRRLGGEVRHVDVTVICEAPKIGPHRAEMRKNIAKVLDLDIGRVSVKATTTEKLGFTGRGEGIAAQAVATIALPLPSQPESPQ